MKNDMHPFKKNLIQFLFFQKNKTSRNPLLNKFKSILFKFVYYILRSVPLTTKVIYFR